MLSAFIFYTLLFLALIVVPAGLILVVLLLLDHEHRFWKAGTRLFGSLGARMAQRVDHLALPRRFPPEDDDVHADAHGAGQRSRLGSPIRRHGAAWHCRHRSRRQWPRSRPLVGESDHRPPDRVAEGWAPD